MHNSKAAMAARGVEDFCVVCQLDFDSHRWIRPAIATTAGLLYGHDFTPRHGPPIPHPFWTPWGDGFKRYVKS